MRKHESTQGPYFMVTDYDMGEGREKKRVNKKCRSYNISSFPCDKKLHRRNAQPLLEITGSTQSRSKI
jgi:hypothetical protein